MLSLIFDTETTGLIKNSMQKLENQPSIIEFFGLSLDGSEEKGTWHSFFKQPKKLDKIITQITGITDESLVTAPAFKEKAEGLKSFIESHDEIVAHNASFDRYMVDFDMERAGLKVVWPRIICTVEATEYVKGHRLKLSELHEYLFGEKFEGAHRAENDVRALARCFNQLRSIGVV